MRLRPALEAFIDALVEGAAAALRGIVVVAEHERPNALPHTIAWVHGDPTSETALERASVGTAALAILVGPWPADPSNPDAGLVLTALAIRRVARRFADCRVRLRLVGAAVDPRHAEDARAAGSDEVVKASTACPDSVP